LWRWKFILDGRQRRQVPRRIVWRLLQSGRALLALDALADQLQAPHAAAKGQHSLQKLVHVLDDGLLLVLPAAFRRAAQAAESARLLHHRRNARDGGKKSRG